MHEDAVAEAARIRAQAEREAAAYVDAARRRADAFAEQRIARLRELSDRLIATAETVESRFADATAVKRQLDDLVAALGAAAERAAAEREGPWTATEPRLEAGDAGRPPHRRAHAGAKPAAATVEVIDA